MDIPAIVFAINIAILMAYFGFVSDQLREILSDALMMGCGAALLWAFLSIILMGGYRAVEPNDWIIYSETAMSIDIIILSIDRMIKDW